MPRESAGRSPRAGWGRGRAPPPSRASWRQRTRLAPSHTDSPAFFGDALALDGEVALIGAPYHLRQAGSAFVPEFRVDVDVAHPGPPTEYVAIGHRWLPGVDEHGAPSDRVGHLCWAIELDFVPTTEQGVVTPQRVVDEHEIPLGARCPGPPTRRSIIGLPEALDPSATPRAPRTAPGSYRPRPGRRRFVPTASRTPAFSGPWGGSWTRPRACRQHAPHASPSPRQHETCLFFLVASRARGRIRCLRFLGPSLIITPLGVVTANKGTHGFTETQAAARAPDPLPGRLSSLRTGTAATSHRVG
ncbi:MAG: hypothetical protein AB1486_22605 [Planctomycetota bacterium]